MTDEPDLTVSCEFAGSNLVAGVGDSRALVFGVVLTDAEHNGAVAHVV
jgi:hypothetical protein